MKNRTCLRRIGVAVLCALPLLAAAELFAGLPRLKVPSIGDLRSLPGKLRNQPVDEDRSEPATAPEQELADGRPLALVALPPTPAGADFEFAPSANTGFVPPDASKLEAQRKRRSVALASDMAAIGPVENVPDRGTAEFRALRTQAMAILAKRFAESRSSLEEDAEKVYAESVTWSPMFGDSSPSASAEERDAAQGLSYLVANYIANLNRPRFVVAFAAAVFALDPESSIGAENAASALVASGERLYADPGSRQQLASLRGDAMVVYRYALALSKTDGKWTGRSQSALVNLGNLYIDAGDAARARPALAAARANAPDSWEAALALASSYEMQGRPELARAVLEDKRIALPAMYAALVKGADNFAQTSGATQVSPKYPESEIVKILDTFADQETLTAADFVDLIDEEDARKARRFVDNLSPRGSFAAPDLDGLTQYSTVKSINTPGGTSALADFAERLGSYSRLLVVNLMNQSDNVLGQLGMSVQYNVDIKDVMAHPEKYRNVDIKASVSGAEQARARAEENARLALQARQDLDKGKTDTLLQTVSRQSPEVSIYALRAYDYANPMDVLVQQYNMTMLSRKLQAYSAYFFGVNERTRAALDDIAAIYGKKRASIHKQEEAELAALQRRYAGSNLTRRQLTLKEHELHKRFAADRNAAAEHAWNQATQTAGIAYERKIRPRAEQFYYDAFRNVALISDPVARNRKNEELARILYYSIYQGLTNALIAYGSFEYVEDWDCHCDIESLVELDEAEQTEFDRRESERISRLKKETLRFASGVLPESSQLYQKLDAYGTDLTIPFIPFLSGWVSPVRTNLNLNLKLPAKFSPTLNYSFSENAFTGATTHGGGISVGLKGENGGAKIAATLNVRGAISFDGKGVVSDYSISSASAIDLEAGPVGAGVGGEVGYSSKGGFSSDGVAYAKVTLSNEFGRSLELKLEATARRGNTFSYKAEQEFNPFVDQMNEAAKEAFGEELKEYLSIDPSLKKEIWTGSFAL